MNVSMARKDVEWVEASSYMSENHRAGSLQESHSQNSLFLQCTHHMENFGGRKLIHRRSAVFQGD